MRVAPRRIAALLTRRVARLGLMGWVAAGLIAALSPAQAQEDPSGEWKPLYHEDFAERIPGPDVGDYLGIPINAAGRAKGDAWTATLLELPENQCRPHPADYAWRGPFNLRIWKQVDRFTQKLIAYHTHGSWQQPEQTIWMDGRAHPPAWAPHTWQGFSTGTWEGDTLHVITDHLREGWLRRNGLDRSDDATVSTRLMRHGNYLTVAVMVYDPVYLAAPFLRTTDFVADPQQHIEPYPCETQTGIYHPQGVVPSWLPGTNPYLTEWAARWGIPPQATRGGPETMYPEYITRMATMKRLPRPHASASAQAASAPTVGASGSAPARAPATATATAAAAAAAAAVAPVEAESGGAYPGAPSPEERNALLLNGDGEVHVLLVRRGDEYPEPESSIYMLVGAGGNVTAQVGSNGILLVNTGRAQMTAKLLAALRTLSDAPLRTLIDTDIDAEDSGGNLALAAVGASVTGGDVARVPGSGAGLTTIIAAQPLLDRMSTAGSPDLAPDGAWPTDTYTQDTKDLWFNGESIRIFHAAAAHSDGDSMVYFRHSDVVSAGDVYSTTGYPHIDLARGGSIQGVIAALDRLVYQVMIPGPQNDGGTLVVPNHGYLGSFSDVVFYQEMLIIIRDRVQAMIRKGMTLPQVEAARPTYEYDGRYGSSSGPWTTAQFVAAVYHGLTHPVRPGSAAAAGEAR